MARQKSMSVETDDGEILNVKVRQPVDYREPHKDAESGAVPEFVNISNKKQIIAIPGNSNSIKVFPFGILKGAQWRDMFRTAQSLPDGINRPPFIERVREKDRGYDPKYLLTREQMLEEIGALAAMKPRRTPGGFDPVDADKVKSKVKRIEMLIANAVIVAKPGKDGRDRAMEDREDIVTEAHKRIYSLHKMAEKTSSVSRERMLLGQVPPMTED